MFKTEIIIQNPKEKKFINQLIKIVYTFCPKTVKTPWSLGWLFVYFHERKTTKGRGIL